MPYAKTSVFFDEDDVAKLLTDSGIPAGWASTTTVPNRVGIYGYEWHIEYNYFICLNNIFTYKHSKEFIEQLLLIPTIEARLEYLNMEE